jgi:hypothetical protein
MYMLMVQADKHMFEVFDATEYGLLYGIHKPRLASGLMRIKRSLFDVVLLGYRTRGSVLSGICAKLDCYAAAATALE